MKRTTPVPLCSRLDYIEHKQQKELVRLQVSMNKHLLLNVSEERAYTENSLNITISQIRVWV